MSARRLLLQGIKRTYSQQNQSVGGSKSASGQPKAAKPKELIATGLSSNCVKPATGLVGPGASTTGEYKVPEYFCYDRTSYFEAEVEMANFRCPQPSALKK